MKKIIRSLKRHHDSPRPGFRQDGWGEFPGNTEPTQYTKTDALHPWPDETTVEETR